MGTLGPLSDRVTDPAPLRLPGKSQASEALAPTRSSGEQGRPGSSFRKHSGLTQNPESDMQQWWREPPPHPLATLPSSSVSLLSGEAGWAWEGRQSSPVGSVSLTAVL